ncbi:MULTISPECIES: DUF2306 domain-containing protein [Actinoalloteichus]|uniref:Membrane protein n=1 Tax=Actinoalloteichus fjordicus TaxID=1612552 RepID=A0AAC9PUG0_9PSEU|nr:MULTISPECIES: DUF2306 domain-containing protein [Actinoalloteichus]APU17153.1 putative membrane protein [Actinoalloteichus fjordicus]APU23235.1 putative membrane protein [Actinoalloteichus sp. GBA129-24]
MTTTSKSTRRRAWWVLWSLLAASAVGIAFFAVSPYLTGDPENSTMPLNPDVSSHFLTLVLHAAPGGLALIIGPFQFVGRLRTRFPKAHRILGRVYLICILAGSVAAVVAATVSTSGFAAQVGFYLLTVAWLYTIAQAYRTIRRGEVALHRIWMIRNYALTFAAVTLRIYLSVGLVMQEADPSLTFQDVYTASAWASFVGNVLVAEYFIVQRTLQYSVRRRRGGGDAPRTGRASENLGSGASAAEQPG